MAGHAPCEFVFFFTQATARYGFAGFSFFLCRRKTANLIDNEIHVTAETISIGQTWKHLQDDTILTKVKKRHLLFFRVLQGLTPGISLQEGNRGRYFERVFSGKDYRSGNKPKVRYF